MIILEIQDGYHFQDGHHQVINVPYNKKYIYFMLTNYNVIGVNCNVYNHVEADSVYFKPIYCCVVVFDHSDHF